MNECIFVTCYPNTKDKIKILERCIDSLKESEYNIVLVSNMRIPDQIIEKADYFLMGENTECLYRNFFTDKEIDIARNSSKYSLHFTPPDGKTISYRSFSYGRGSTYHWSAISQHSLILKYSHKNKVKRALIIEGDTILKGKDFSKIRENFSILEREGLDFIISMQYNMNHMSGGAWFTDIEFWTRVYSEMSMEDFLKSTYPSFSSEEYMILKMKKIGGTGKVLVGDANFYFYEEFPEGWKILDVKNSKGGNFSDSINLFFPETDEINLSSNVNREDQSPSDPMSYVWMGTGRREEAPVFFVWNRYNGQTVEKIKLMVNILNNKDLTFSTEFNLFPGEWSWIPVLELNSDSFCEINISVEDKEGNVFNYSDRFGEIGDL